MVPSVFPHVRAITANNQPKQSNTAGTAVRVVTTVCHLPASPRSPPASAASFVRRSHHLIHKSDCISPSNVCPLLYIATCPHSARSRGGVMNVHKHRLHEPRTKGVSAPCRLNQTQQSVTQSKSSRRRYEQRDPVEERMDTEDSFSYMIQSHEMIDIPASL